MNKQQIKDQLNANRGKILIKDSSPKISILATIQVAKKKSKTFDESLAVFGVEGRRCLYVKGYSSSNLPSSPVGACRLNPKQSRAILSAIESYNKYKHYHVNPYTWLVCVCLQEGVDLIEDHILET